MGEDIGRTRWAPTVSILLLMCVPIVCGTALAPFVRPFTSIQIGTVNPQIAEAHRAAALWATSYMAYVAAAIWNIIVASWIVHKYLPMRARQVIFATAAVISVGALFVRSVYASPVAPLSLITAAGVPIYRVTAIGNALLAATLVLFVAACGALLNREGEGHIGERSLRERMAYTRLSMYSAAALLVIGVIQIYCLNDWPAHTFHDTTEGSRLALHELAYTAAVVSGALYSVILLMLYLPVLLVHDGWVTIFAEEAVAQSSIDLSKWREAHGLGRTAAETIGQVVAVVGPWATALGIPKLLTGA
jgi:putative flippase GtrA